MLKRECELMGEKVPFLRARMKSEIYTKKEKRQKREEVQWKFKEKRFKSEKKKINR